MGTVLFNVSTGASVWAHAVLAERRYVWAPDAASAEPLLAGLRDAATAYGVPIVGGHTNLRSDRSQLAVAVLGETASPLSSRAASALRATRRIGDSAARRLIVRVARGRPEV